MKNKLVIFNNPNSSSSRSIRMLRKNLQFSLENKEFKSIMITSSIDGEGKTFITSNLAASFGKNGYNVLIIDSDFKNGNQDKIFNLSNEKGFSDLLSGDIKEFKKYIKKTDIENVSLLTSGNKICNYNEILVLEKSKELFDLLNKEYDLILLDCSSIKESTDSLDFSNIVDKILIICSINKTTKSMLKATKNILKQTEDKILGVVVNRVEDYLYK